MMLYAKLRRSLPIVMMAAVWAAAALPSQAEEGEKAAEKAEKKEKKRTADVVYVPTPNDVVARMLRMAKLSEDDVVYDLGCGDGRIVVTAAKKYGCKGKGFEIDPERLKMSHANVKENNVGDLVGIVDKDIYKVDLSDATVIMTYLLPSMNTKLIPQFDKMKPGSRIVCHAYRIKGVKPDKVISMTSREDADDHTIYLYTVPLNKIEKKKDDEKAATGDAETSE